MKRRSNITVSPGLLLPNLLEIPQVRRRLVFLGRHQIAVGAEHIVLFPDTDMLVALSTNRLDPDRVALATIVLSYRPRSGQRIVDRCNFVMENVRIRFVEVDPLLDHGLIVRVQRDAAGVESARTFKVAGLDLEHVIAAASVLIDPLAD